MNSTAAFAVRQKRAREENELTQESTLKLNFSKLRDPKKPFVIQAALEGPNAIVGGLGIVVRDICGQLATHKGNTLTVTPFYHFLKEKFQNIPSLGLFKHFLFNREITTEVFFNKNDHQLLFSPDETIEDGLLVVKDSKEIYANNQSYLRLVYFNSAIAKFVDLIDADIVQLHAWQTALTAALLKRKYNPKREENNKKPIKIISTIHMLNQEQGVDSGVMFSHVGLPQESDRINLAAIGIKESDYLTTVSKGMVASFKDPETSFGLFDLFQDKGEKIQGITNGITYSKFSPFLKENLGEYALTPEFTIEELKEKKHLVKELLYSKNIIPSPSMPLMLAILRFSEEKGVDLLEPAAEKWLKMGGQVVVMGQFTQDEKSKEKILSLKNNEKLKYLKVYTELSDQTSNLSEEIPLQIGKLVRFATDVKIIPSKVESCGLVGMELLSQGAFVCTSWVQGLKDMILPYGVHHPLLNKKIDEKNFNGVSFQYFPRGHQRTIIDLKKNLMRCYSLINGAIIPLEKIWLAKKDIIYQAKKFDWLDETGALNQYTDLYTKLIGSTFQTFNVHSFQPTPDEDHLVQLLVQEYGAYPANKVEFPYTKYAPLILSTLSKGMREKETIANPSNLKEKTRAKISNGNILFQSHLFNTKTIQSKDRSFGITWIMNKKGDLFVGSQCHAFFLKSKPGNPHYGYAKPTACGGDVIIEHGKIKYIDNRSGHYMHRKEQFLLSLNHLYKQNLLADDCEIKLESTGESIPLSVVETLKIDETLAR